MFSMCFVPLRGGYEFENEAKTPGQDSKTSSNVGFHLSIESFKKYL